MFKYAVVLLNYYTNEDVLTAIESIKESAIDDNYRIVVVNINEKNRNPMHVDDDKVEIINIDENKGFAFGNNVGVCFAAEKIFSKYVVIMNPDTKILRTGTIDRLIEHIDHFRANDASLVGGQPSIRTKDSESLSIRRVYSYFDSIIQVFFPLRVLFKTRYKRMWYKDLDDGTSTNFVKYEVPAGNFFIIDTNFFWDQLSGFDTDTFLYEEEIILGYRLKKRGFHLILDRNEEVFHEQGKSTNSHKRLSYFAFQHMIHSKNVYLKKYLQVSKLSIILLDVLFLTNFLLMRLFRR